MPFTLMKKQGKPDYCAKSNQNTKAAEAKNAPPASVDDLLLRSELTLKESAPPLLS